MLTAKATKFISQRLPFERLEILKTDMLEMFKVLLYNNFSITNLSHISFTKIFQMENREWFIAVVHLLIYLMARIYPILNKLVPSKPQKILHLIS
jgi:hypothetical protein